MDGWSFPEEPRYEAAYATVRFVAVNGEKRYPCAISQSALNDRYQSKDDRESALENYKKNADRIHEIAVRLIEQGRIHSSNVYFITSAEIQEFRL